MSAERFDLVVVGGGPAGQKAAIQGAKAGKRVVLVDKLREPGGECVRRGTIPSKTLRETALWFSGAKRHFPSLSDLRPTDEGKVESLMRRLGAVRSSHETFMSFQLERNGVAYWRGRASFLNEHELVVRAPDGAERRIHGEHVVIATGSRPRRPENVPIDHENVLDSDSILSLIYLPASLTVLGSGVIACEFASIFAALGVQVTLIDKAERPLGFLEPELVDVFSASFAALGGTYLAGRSLARVEWDGLSSVVTHLAGGEAIRSEKLLCALGRIACVHELDLERTGIELTDRGLIPVDANYRTAVPHIYAAGDAIGPPALAASSMEQGRHAVRHALGLPSESFAGFLPTGIYTIPEMASIGLTEAQAVAKHGSAVVGRASFAELARGQISGDTDGLLKLVADPTGTAIAGAHIVGAGATELIHVAQMAMIGGTTVDAFVDHIFNFPTMAEAYRVAALKLVQARESVLRKVG